MAEKPILSVLKMVLKLSPSKAVVIRLNLVFFALFFVTYTVVLLKPSSSAYFENTASLVRCTLRECHHKVERGVRMQEVTEESQTGFRSNNLTKMEVPRFVDELLTGGSSGFGRRAKIAMVNVEEHDVTGWERHGDLIHIPFERVSKYFKWPDLFPEWIDEEEEDDGTSCPEIPMPDLDAIDDVDVVVSELPCRYPEKNWAREVARLQVHLVVAKVAAERGRRDWKGRTKVVMRSKCRPMMELFRCDDMVRREGSWWLYSPEVVRLEQKLEHPVGSCKLALPLWGQGVDEVFDKSRIEATTKTPKREAYATVLHSSEAYVCGAITLAQSLLKTGTRRDLVLLLDASISGPKRQALAQAGWKIRMIKRIRNPKAEKNTYNEYNYSKFRLWQLTEYDKVVFIDADIIVLRNLDLLFHFPQISAVGNSAWIFNSGIMVIEPSNCTFRVLMSQRNDVVSYNGGDQGFLNEIFTWWHRLPRRVNYLKNFWANTTLEANLKNGLFARDPPALYSIHFLGWKPWLCYRDYDCNFDVEDQIRYASDAAHARWWRLHDELDERLQRFCMLTRKRRMELNWEKRKAMKKGLSNQHWKINVTDPRKKHVVD